MPDRGRASERSLLDRGPQTLAAIASVLIAAYFLIVTRDVWHAYFAPDDLMNLYRSWAFPLGTLIKANLLFFLNSDFFRPLGSVWYRSIYYFAGFHPLPFHAVNMVFLLANLWLTYCIVRRLTASREAGALAALLISYHSHFAYLYFNTGYVYDVLCYFFYFAAVLLYVRARQGQRPLLAWELAACLLLYICALNSKELALTLPIALIVYELLYERRPRVSEFTRWSLHEGRGLLTIGALTLLFAAGRALDHNSLLDQSPYQPVFTLHRFLVTSRHFENDLFFLDRGVNSVVLFGLWAALFAIAWISRSRPLKFAWLFLMLSPLPLAFIEPRAAAQYYIPFFGWVLYAATGIVLLTKRLTPPTFATARAPLLFLVTVAVLFAVSNGTAWARVPFVSDEGEMLRSFVAEMHALQPAIRPGSRILFVDDPIEAGRQDMIFLVRLSYRDDTLEVDRAKTMEPPPTAQQIAAYDYVFDYRGGHLVSVKPLLSAAQNTSRSTSR